MILPSCSRFLASWARIDKEVNKRYLLRVYTNTEKNINISKLLDFATNRIDQGVLVTRDTDDGRCVTST